MPIGWGLIDFTDFFSEFDWVNDDDWDDDKDEKDEDEDDNVDEDDELVARTFLNEPLVTPIVKTNGLLFPMKGCVELAVVKSNGIEFDVVVAIDDMCDWQ